MSDRVLKKPGKKPSRLGLSIQSAIESAPRFVKHQPDRQYQCTFRTVGSGRVFAVERVTENAIRLWLPSRDRVSAALDSEGLIVLQMSLPYPDREHPERYGRLSSLKSVPELRDERLLPVPVSSPDQALRILSALV